MRMLASALLATALLLACFAWWGTQTAAGRHAYDEMAGIVPYGAGLLGIVAGSLAILLLWLDARRDRRQRRLRGERPAQDDRRAS